VIIDVFLLVIMQNLVQVEQNFERAILTTSGSEPAKKVDRLLIAFTRFLHRFSVKP
jgi:hypothetical protein